MFPGGSNGRIPIAAVTGSAGKTTTSRMVAHILSQKGFTTGLTTTDAVYLDGDLVRRGDFAWSLGARIVLMDPSVDVAVLETARGGIINNGLAFDHSNVGAVLNIGQDHIELFLRHDSRRRGQDLAPQRSTPLQTDDRQRAVVFKEADVVLQRVVGDSMLQPDFTNSRGWVIRVVV